MPTPTTAPRDVSYLTAGAAPTTFTTGTATRIAGTLLDQTTGQAIAGRQVLVYTRRHGTGAWSAIARLTSQPDGTIQLVFKPTANTDYRLTYVGDSSTTAATSASHVLWVRRSASINASATRIRHGRTVTIKGRVHPNDAHHYIYLQRYYARAWHTIRKLWVTSSDVYMARVALAQKGTYKLRVRIPADAAHLSGQSATLRLYAS